MITVELYRLEAFIVPVPPGEDPPDGATFLGHLELTEEELRAWQGTVATQIAEDLGDRNVLRRSRIGM